MAKFVEVTTTDDMNRMINIDHIIQTVSIGEVVRIYLSNGEQMPVRDENAQRILQALQG